MQKMKTLYCKNAKNRLWIEIMKKEELENWRYKFRRVIKSRINLHHKLINYAGHKEGKKKENNFYLQK